MLYRTFCERPDLGNSCTELSMLVEDEEDFSTGHTVDNVSRFIKQGKPFEIVKKLVDNTLRVINLAFTGEFTMPTIGLPHGTASWYCAKYALNRMPEIASIIFYMSGTPSFGTFFELIREIKNLRSLHLDCSYDSDMEEIEEDNWKDAPDMQLAGEHVRIQKQRGRIC